MKNNNSKLSYIEQLIYDGASVEEITQKAKAAYEVVKKKKAEEEAAKKAAAEKETKLEQHRKQLIAAIINYYSAIGVTGEERDIKEMELSIRETLDLIEKLARVGVSANIFNTKM